MSAVLPGHAYVAALAGLPHLTPSRLRRLLADRDPVKTWESIRAGKLHWGLLDPGVGHADSSKPGEPGPPPELIPVFASQPEPSWTPAALARAWRVHAERTDPGDVWTAYQAAGIQVCAHGGDNYPAVLDEDPEAPPVLFWLGSLSALERPTVALVGTRACSHYGEEVAAELGSGLSEAGVSVVSGLALGIDGAAHRGALARGGAPPLGIAGSGLDVIYPRRHARLWQQVGTRGGLVSEAPLGAAAEAWRFPWRNRLIAALSDVVVVVESHRAGGALLTVEAAMRRGVTVLAVPGSVRSPASVGTNALIADGCPPARDVDDVLVALGLSRSTSHRVQQVHSCIPAPPAPPDSLEGMIWASLDSEPTPTEVILARTGLPLGEVAAALDHLAEAGWLRAGDGWWQQVVKVPSCSAD